MSTPVYVPTFALRYFVRSPPLPHAKSSTRSFSRTYALMSMLFT